MGWFRLVSGLTSLRFSKLTWASVRRTGEGVGPGWSWEAVTAVGAHDGGLDRVAQQKWEKQSDSGHSLRKSHLDSPRFGW